MGVLSPRDSADYIVKNARDVTIDQGGICKVADVVLDCYNRGLVGTHAWRDHPLHPKVADDSAAQWVFLVDALNFNFWSKDSAQKYAVRWNGTLHTGYFSLCAAVARALEAACCAMFGSHVLRSLDFRSAASSDHAEKVLQGPFKALQCEEGVPLLNAEFCSSISLQQVEKIFRSDTNVDIPLLKERHQVLQEWGHVLSNMYDGSFANCIRECENSCQALLKNVVENFASFQDEGTFDGVKVSFYKRAQILVADLWSCFDGKGLGHFEDIGTLTAFADYRVPQVLAYFGALQYSTQLSSLLTEGCLLESGSREEMEIRGATIHACELVREELKKKMQASEEINSILVDYCLWDYRRKHANEVEHTPFHRVRCIYY